MIVIFPMNGKGQRFKDAGYNIPKILLPLPDGHMFKKIGEAYTYPGWKPLFIVPHELGNFIKIEHVEIHHETSGPLETILSVLYDIPNEEGILIADCDAFFENQQELLDAVEEFRKSTASGGITVRRTTDPGCSYARVTNGWATDFREKDPFTEWSTTGPYYWKNWGTFYKCALQSYWDGVTSIAPVYNYLKEPVRAVEVKTFVHLGTPENYLAYCRRTNLQST